MALKDYSQPTWTITPQQGQQLNSVAFDSSAKNALTSTSQEYGKTNVGVYCYSFDGNSVTLSWSKNIASNVDYGTFWVAMSPSGNYCAAAGHTSTSDGYLNLYSVADGSTAGTFAFTSRVNEIEFTGQGEQFIAVQGSNVILGALSGTSYNQETTSINAQSYMRTCAASSENTWAVAAGAIYPPNQSDSKSESSEPTGVIYFFQTVNGVFTYRNVATLDHEVLRIAITPDGKYCAATDNNGHVHLYNTSNPIPLWSYTPAYACDLTYAAAIAYDSSGDVMVAVGTNISVTSSPQSEASKAFQVQPGLVYVLKNVADSQAPTGFNYEVQWQQRIEYPPNPGMNFSADASLLTCATGQPYDTLNETTGSFYLFDGATGFQYWRHDTSIMNWPMNINPSATACIGGSDNGTLYYWGEPVS